MATPDDEVNEIYSILSDFSHTTILSLIGDLCFLGQWQPTLTVGDTDTVGDLVVRQTVPFPKRIAILYHDRESFSVSKAEEVIEKFEDGQESKLTVIVQSQPDSEAIELFDRPDIGLIGLGDLAHTIAMTDAADILASYLEDDTQSTSTQSSKSASEGQSSSQTDTITSNVTAETPFLSVELLGYDYYESPAFETSGMLVAMEVKSTEDDLVLKTDSFTFHSSDDFTYAAAESSINDQSEGVADFLTQLDQQLPDEWAHDDYNRDVSISGGGRVRFIQYFPCSDPKELQKVRYKADRLRHVLQITDEQIESTYGIPQNAGSDDEYGSWDPFVFELTLAPSQRESYRSLPDQLASALKSL